MARLLLSLLSVALFQVAGTFTTYWNVDAGIGSLDLLNLSVRVLFMQQLYSTLFLSIYVLCLYAVIQHRGEKLELIRRLRKPRVQTKVQFPPK